MGTGTGSLPKMQIAFARNAGTVSHIHRGNHVTGKPARFAMFPLSAMSLHQKTRVQTQLKQNPKQ
jgi:hypothetical protein